MASIQKQIPSTSIDRYISGRYALNIPSDTSGDWHFTTVWFANKPTIIDLWGVGQKVDTTKLFGHFGIANRTTDIDKTGLQHDKSPIYAANHLRAILDMAIDGSTRNNMCLVKGATIDYLDTQEQKDLIINMIDKIILSNKLTSAQKECLRNWVTTERQNIYRGELYEV